MVLLFSKVYKLIQFLHLNLLYLLIRDNLLSKNLQAGCYSQFKFIIVLAAVCSSLLIISAKTWLHLDCPWKSWWWWRAPCLTSAPLPWFPRSSRPEKACGQAGKRTPLVRDFHIGVDDSWLSDYDVTWVIPGRFRSKPLINHVYSLMTNLPCFYGKILLHDELFPLLFVLIDFESYYKLNVHY